MDSESRASSPICFSLPDDDVISVDGASQSLQSGDEGLHVSFNHTYSGGESDNSIEEGKCRDAFWKGDRTILAFMPYPMFT